MASYNVSKKEAARLGIARTKSGSSKSSSGAPKMPKIKDFKFDSSKLIPQYQQEASSIYTPYSQQIEALRGLSKAQAEDQRVRTKDEFAQLLKREQENINRRGAFFGQGAVDRENRIGAQEGGALRDIGYQEQAQDYQYQGTLSEIEQAKKEYISSKVEGAYSSAYKAFQDKIANQMTQYQLELGQYNTDRAFEQSKIESDRNYQLAVNADRRAGSSAGNAENNLKAALTEQVYSGAISREAAKQIYSQKYPNSDPNWIYKAASDGYESNIISSKTSKPIPAGVAEDFATMDVLNSYAKEIIEKTNLPGTSGFFGGTIAQKAAKEGLEFGTGGAEGQKIRNQIGNIQATIAKLRGGTSFTENEQKLLETYTPTINDSDFVKKQKLKDLSRFIEDKKVIMQAYLGNSTLPYNVNYGAHNPYDLSDAQLEKEFAR